VYRVLVVDDEYWVRKGIVAKLGDCGIRFEWVREASCGKEAAEMIRRLNPDIVLADIRMPDMDGLELIRLTRGAGLSTRFIIISGYAEFEYAQEALKSGVSAYLLKPISDEDFTQAVGKVVGLLDQENSVRDMIASTRRIEQSNSALTSERELNRIFSEEAGGEGKAVSADGAGSRYYLILLHLLNAKFRQDTGRIEEKKAQVKALLAQAELPPGTTAAENYHNAREIFLLVKTDASAAAADRPEAAAERVFRLIVTENGLSAVLAVSGVQAAVTKRLYEQARSAFAQRLFNGDRSVYFYKGDKPEKKEDIGRLNFRMLQKSMEENDCKNIRIFLRKAVVTDRPDTVTVFSLRSSIREVLDIMIRICREREIEIPPELDFGQLADDLIEDLDSLDGMAGFLYDLIVNTLSLNSGVFADCGEIAENLRERIDRSWSEEYSVKDEAAQYGVNPNYFSTVFKEKTGYTINRYLTNVRLKEACRLLKDTEMPIVSVAKAVGYENPQYFHRVFKKYRKMTAFEYRRSFRKTAD
jgi:two-component system response regulator YesN